MAVGGGQGDGGEAGGIAAATAIAFSSPMTVLPAASKVASAVSGGTGPVNLSTSKVARAQSMMLFDGTKQANGSTCIRIKTTNPAQFIQIRLGPTIPELRKLHDQDA